MHPWSVLSVREGGRFDEQNRPVRTMVVQYKVGPDGPFTLEMDAAGFTGAAMEQRLDEAAAQILRLRQAGP